MLDLESLGFTKEELQNRVVDRICDQVMMGRVFDEDGEEFLQGSTFARELEKKVQIRIDETISALAEKYVLPNVSEYIENLTLQTTNKWGEKKGQSLTFVEYLVSRAESYMTEMVSHEGKSKDESSSSYSFCGVQTRLTYLIHKHLHYSIETAMKNALAVANSSIAQGIQETVKMKLEEITKSIQIKVEPKR